MQVSSEEMLCQSAQRLFCDIGDSPGHGVYVKQKQTCYFSFLAINRKPLFFRDVLLRSAAVRVDGWVVSVVEPSKDQSGRSLLLICTISLCFRKSRQSLLRVLA